MRPVLLGVVALASAAIAVAGAPSASVAIQQQILQLVLNNRSLEQYLHPEASGRVPVQVGGVGVSTQVKLQKFGVPVRIVSGTNANGPLVNITHLVISPNTASLQVEYPIEGVIGNFIFANHAGRWSITEANVHER